MYCNNRPACNASTKKINKTTYTCEPNYPLNFLGIHYLCVVCSSSTKIHFAVVDVALEYADSCDVLCKNTRSCALSSKHT